MSLPRLTGGTVDLLCGGIAHIEAEGRDVAELCAMLGVRVPPQWPPEHNDENTRAWFISGLTEYPGSEPWWVYYVILHDDGGDVLVGGAGFTGPPQDNEVEIGYAILPQYQRRGLASAAVGMLVANAFERGVTKVKANTLADGVASQGVLTKCGFIKTGETVDPDEGAVWSFAVERA